MRARRTLLTTICLAASLMLTACAGDHAAAGPAAPTAVSAPAASTAPLRVQVDSVCAGRETEIRVFIDAEPIGVTNPSEPGVARLVTVGNHLVSAISQRGTEWGPFPTTVDAGGLVERLGCMPADAL